MRRISKDEDEKIVQMYSSGEKVDYIATIMDCSMTTVQRHARSAGFKRGKGCRSTTIYVPVPETTT